MNVFFLISGVLAIILAVTHAVWGEKLIIPDLKKSGLPDLAKIGFHISWHQISMVLLVSGISLVVLAFLTDCAGSKVGATIIVGITSANFLVFLVLSFIQKKALFGKSIPQIILFVTLIALIIIGMVL
ncbi:hypothetical protein ACFL4P_02180 [Gemmatimonadota bacterium]